MDQRDDALTDQLIKTLEIIPPALRAIHYELAILREATHHLVRAMESMHETLGTLTEQIFPDAQDDE